MILRACSRRLLGPAPQNSAKALVILPNRHVSNPKMARRPRRCFTRYTLCISFIAVQGQRHIKLQLGKLALRNTLKSQYSVQLRVYYTPNDDNLHD